MAQLNRHNWRRRQAAKYFFFLTLLSAVSARKGTADIYFSVLIGARQDCFIFRREQQLRDREFSEPRRLIAQKLPSEPQARGPAAGPGGEKRLYDPWPASWCDVFQPTQLYFTLPRQPVSA